MKKYFYQLTPEEAIKRLDTSVEKGLSSAEVKKRQVTHGFNTLKEGKRRPLILRFFDQFRDLLIIVLIVAALLAYYLQDFHGGTILLVIVFVNACIGFYQEHKAEQILNSLKKIIKAKAIVIRDGKRREVEELELVPGDIVYLEEGGVVPADVRLIETNNFSTNDFILTGESVPQEKKAELLFDEETTLTNQDNSVFLGTTVAKGNALAVVYATGMATAIGRIAKTSESIEHDLSPLQKEMNSLAKTLTKIAGFIAVALFVINFLLQYDQYENVKLLINVSLLFAIGVGAACVPQGLPTQISVALSLGVGRLAAKNAVVKKISAVETLGSATVICSDKTGTITRNEMTITHCYVNGREFTVLGEGYEPEGAIQEGGKTMTSEALEPIKQFFEDGLLASNGRTHAPDDEHPTWYCIGDPTEAAFTPLAFKAGFIPEDLDKRFPVVGELPFDSDRKRMTMIREHKGNKIGYMKGGLETVISCCTKINHAGEVRDLTEKEKAEMIKIGEQFSSKALRVIALAYRDFPKTKKAFSIAEDEADFVLAGFVAMIDPPRKGLKEAIQSAYDAHIRIMMITGDNPITAQAIAESIGMRNGNDPIRVIIGDEMKTMADGHLKEVLKKQSVIFARISPEDKYRLVNLLKQMGDVVAVTGDGVNDTLSLKRSDIGVSMGKLGSEVAKEASEVVLLDDNFGTLIVAIKEGRTIFFNLKKTIIANITANFGELSCVLFGFVGVVYGLPIPITAVQILAVDLLAEILPLTALTFDPAPKGLLTNKPRNLNLHVMNPYSLAAVSVFGIIHGLLAYASFFIVYRQTGSLGQSQAAAYATLVTCQLINVLSERTDRSFFSKYLFTNAQLWGAILISAIAVWSIINISALSVWFGFGALSLHQWLYPLIGALVLLVLHELVKIMITRGWMRSWLIEG